MSLIVLYNSHFFVFVTARPKAELDFAGRKVIAREGEPFKVRVPYKGFPVPKTEWVKVFIELF